MRTFLGAYWGNRKESVRACAERLERFVTDIQASDPSFSRWFRKGRTLKGAHSAIDMSVDEIQFLLKTNNRDDNGQPIQELGFGFSAWNGERCSLAAQMGSFSSPTPNSVLLETRDELPMSTWKHVADCAIAAFDPDALIVTNDELSAKSSAVPIWTRPGLINFRRAS